MKFKLSTHAQDVLRERKIIEEWLQRTISHADWTTGGNDGNTHYYKSIAEHDGRVLHVVVNPTTGIIVTMFFDRRARSRK